MLGTTPAATMAYTDPSPGIPGGVLEYWVKAVDAAENPSTDSNHVRVTCYFEEVGYDSGESY